MHILQHVLLCVREFGSGEWVNEHLAYVALPDAIRGLGIPRRCSHFERNEHGDLSLYRFPGREPLRVICKENDQWVLNSTMYAAKVQQTIKGGSSDIRAYQAFNPDLDAVENEGILVHLIEDIAYDRSIERVIDFAGINEDRIMLGKTVLTGKEFRNVVAESERDGIIILGKDILERHGIVVNNDWIKSYVGAILKRDLSPELFANQMKYIRLDADAEEQIKNGNYPTCEGHLASVEDWERLYDAVGHDVNELAHGNKNVLEKYEI